MSRRKTREELHSHQQSAIGKINDYLTGLIDSDNEDLHGKADKLSYWLQDWTEFLKYEPDFTPRNLKTYKRGQIIKVHLGFNIGSEEGGLHYAVVVDTKNARLSPVVTIIPLTSVKPHIDVQNLHRGNVFLGNELYTSLNVKLSSTLRHLSDEIAIINSIVESNNNQPTEEFIQKLEQLYTEIEFAQKMRLEIAKMKRGSIALVNQITTVSKIRIYVPKTDHDILNDIRLSNEKLDQLDAEVIKMYTKQ